MTYSTIPLAGEDEPEPGQARRDLEADRQALRGTPEDGAVSATLLALYAQEGREFDAGTTAMLDGFEIMDSQTDSGGVLIRPQGNPDYGLEVTGSSVEVAGMDDAQRLTNEGLEATMESALVAATLPNAENGIYVYHSDPTVAQTMARAAKLAGMTVMNDDALALEGGEMSPELAERVEAAWQRVAERHGLDTPADEAPEAASPSADADAEAGVDPGADAGEPGATELPPEPLPVTIPAAEGFDI